MKKRILFVGNGVTLAHIGRPLVLANAADTTRYQIHFACDTRYRRWLGKFDSSWKKIHTQSSDDFIAALARGDPPYSCDSLCKDTEEDLDLLDDIRPDLVIADFRLSMRIATTLRQVPYVTITNTHWSPIFSGRYRLPDLIHAWPSRMIGSRNLARIGEIFLPAILRRFVQPMNRARRRFGLPPIANRIQHVYAGADHFIYAESEEFSPFPDLPLNHYFAGGLVWDPPLELPSWWLALPTHRPIVYVGMGSSGDASVIPSILSGLQDLPVTIIVSTAGRCKLASQSDSLFCADYLPGSSVARVAALAIGSGGSMMLYQMLREGVPVLGIPSNMDQQMCVMPFIAKGAVRTLRLASVSRKTIRSAVASMLDDSQCREKCRAIATQLQACDTQARFNQILTNIMRSS